MLLIVLLAICAAVTLVLVGILVQAGRLAWLMTVVTRLPVVGHPAELGIGFEDVGFPSRYDRVLLSGWYLPATPDTRCIILIQGYGHHRNSPAARALQLGGSLVGRGFSVLLFDFRGRGESGGRRGSAGDREQWDVLGAIDYVARRGIPVERIALLGFSLGAGVAIMVAAQESRIAAIVSDSGFLDSMEDLENLSLFGLPLPSWFGVPILVIGRTIFGVDVSKVRPVKVVENIAQPIFFIHGEDDDVIPADETWELHRVSAGRQDEIWVVPGAGHIASHRRMPDEYAKRVADFFQRHIK
ncbi:MAG: alpha/beta fold hydrolase [SAR202 cluster bacterium]|nr:alpha/beta fold hydrolase [SAR202 cluster bacterium]